MLTPKITSTREVLNLDGLWRFDLDAAVGEEPWRATLRTTREAPVPASYNDLFPDPRFRDHVGVAWYQRTVRVPHGWRGTRVMLRLDAATHEAAVYVDDDLVVTHVGGYTPFEVDITGHVTAGGEFRLTIGVDNRLTPSSIPPGSVDTDSLGRPRQRYMHDFFNYGGLARSVSIQSVPAERIDDITVTTEIDGTSGLVSYDLVTTDLTPGAEVRLRVLTADGTVVGASSGSRGVVEIPDVRLWRPGAAYLYTVVAEIVRDGEVRDSYPLAVGVRTVEVRGNRVLINGEPFYFTGFGKHEDSPVRGKGHDPAYLVHDFELMRWTGANSFRTSHYPYAEEVLDYADRQGIVVIGEAAAVGLNLAIAAGYLGQTEVTTFGPRGAFGDTTRDAHAAHLRELIARDKNHPSIVMWSIANEPDSRDPGARDYFAPLVSLTRELDPTRPVTYANMILAQHDTDVIADLFDVVSINRYYGWYQDTNDLAAAEAHLEADLRGWEASFHKPIIVSEFGADAIAGLHAAVDQPWSEDYQTALVAMYQRVFDRIDSVVGEHVWAFADFQAMPITQRVDGNKKGVFTRDRRPKAVAHALRARWTSLSQAKNPE
ncbi:beta-glucuronidase [Microbacterium sp. W1N]|uniref:beta-glucuronidase n=1 Tax=Microbacterium festucae TaxID=2977531 RepID=UPI0021BEA267|nr:beta-glucuronidase [Microbacterium festucae]MCT9821358.1 beta-glucuronidase [Microbacterium festucae]